MIIRLKKSQKVQNLWVFGIIIKLVYNIVKK